MIQRPPSGLPPAERQVLRRAGVTFAAGVGLCVALTVTLFWLGVNENVIFAVVAPIAVGTGVFLVFGVLKIQRYGAEVRRQQRARPRRERVMELAFGLAIGILGVFGLWSEASASWALGLAILLGITLVWWIFDIWRGPQG